jgi:hypothetical protein
MDERRTELGRIGRHENIVGVLKNAHDFRCWPGAISAGS